MKILEIHNSFWMSAVATTVVMALLSVSFLFLEPQVGRAASQDLTVSSTITAEISLSVASTSLSLSPAVAGGITGGIANGSTNVIVTTNNSVGYNMTIQFSSSTAMYREGGGSGSGNIYNYVSTSTPDYSFDSGQVYAQFGYSAYSTTDAGDIDPTFLSNGSNACNTGSTAAVDTCWLAPSSTAAEMIVNRTSATSVSGATTTVQFRVDVPGNSSPIVPTGIYTATATLTAVTN